MLAGTICDHYYGVCVTSIIVFVNLKTRQGNDFHKFWSVTYVPYCHLLTLWALITMTAKPKTL